LPVIAYAAFDSIRPPKIHDLNKHAIPKDFYYEATSRRFIGSKQDAPAYGYEDEFRADEILTLRRYYSSNVDFLQEWG